MIRATAALAVALTVAALLALPATGAGPGSTPDLRRSGFEGMSPATQALQRDDTLNPAMLWVADGQARWQAREGGAKACADCHGDARASMRGVAARHPAWDRSLGRVATLAQRIGQCRTQRQGLPPLAPESDGLLALEAWVGLQSRGLPLAPPAETRLAPVVEQGRQLWRTRFGQLDLACAHCHDTLAGRRLAGSTIPQAHPTGYPQYRLEWQALGSLERRLRNCMTGIRAEPFGWGSPESVALQAWLMRRAAGMMVDTPAVRP